MKHRLYEIKGPAGRVICDRSQLARFEAQGYEVIDDNFQPGSAEPEETPEPEDGGDKSLADCTVKELRMRAKEAGVEGFVGHEQGRSHRGAELRWRAPWSSKTVRS